MPDLDEADKGRATKIRAGESTQPATSQQSLLHSPHIKEQNEATMKKIIDFLPVDDHPFSVVKARGFSNLIHHLSPKYTS